jgi:hypothetical protein
MYCHACGIALTQQTKYCNRCGAQLIKEDQAGELWRSKKRLDEYLDGLFWITVFGVGLVLGGMVAMKKVGLSDFFILVYLVLSSAAFLVNFGLNLRAALRIGRGTGDLKSDERQTSQLDPAPQPVSLYPVSSVTEHTTRSFEPCRRRTETTRVSPDPIVDSPVTFATNSGRTRFI